LSPLWAQADGGGSPPAWHTAGLNWRSDVNVRFDRIARVQAAMREQGLVAIVVMNHDDYRYLFGTDRSQPRALIPFEGPPELIAFTGEEPELRALLANGEVRVFGSVGGQIHDVVGRLRELAAADPFGAVAAGGRPKVGMQMWFHTPAFLVDLFRQVNPQVELVSSDPVMDPLRTIKAPEELAAMTEAQRIAGLGMDRARELLRPGVSAHEVATEALYVMWKAGAEGTSTPIYVNFGVETCMLHGRITPAPLERGQLALIDLTPQVDGYCANLSRSFVAGKPDSRQAELLAAYREIVEAVRGAMCPGLTTSQLDDVAHGVADAHGLGEYHVYGIGHGIGLRFEEPPAPTIIPPHKNMPLAEGMTVTIGHPVLAIPGFGGARFEDVYRLGAGGPDPLVDYPIDPVLSV
jgi:Xaa-Pro aminopeptidase